MVHGPVGLSTLHQSASGGDEHASCVGLHLASCSSRKLVRSICRSFVANSVATANHHLQVRGRPWRPHHARLGRGQAAHRRTAEMAVVARGRSPANMATLGLNHGEKGGKECSGWPAPLGRESEVIRVIRVVDSPQGRGGLMPVGLAFSMS